MRTHRWTMIALWLVVASLGMAASAGDLLLNFDRDTLDQPPKDTACKGEVKVVHHAMKPSKNLSVSLAWGPGKAAPEMSLSPSDQHLPERGLLMMELMIEKKGSPLHILGLTHAGHTVFDFQITSDGRAIGQGADGKQSEIVCVSAPPETNHWYGVQLAYDFPARLFNVQMDTFWKTGDLVGGAMGQNDYLERIVFRGEGQAACSYYVDTIRLVAAEKEPNIPGVASMPLGCYDRKIHWETPLLAERDASCAVVVYPSGMAGGAAQGQKVREAIRQRSGRTVPCISDELVVDSESWLVRDEFLNRPMIVLGNATDNKAIYALV